MLAWFRGCVDFAIYSYREFEFGMNKDDLSFDAAIADAACSSLQINDFSIHCSGLDLYRSAPGRVVLATSLWLRPPPASWIVCVPLPLRDANELFVAVKAALRSESVAPSADEIQEYLAIPAVGSKHLSRSEGGWL